MAPQTGQPFALNLSLGNGGECDGVAFLTTVQLADGLSFVSGTSDYGQLSNNAQIVTLHVGRIAARQTIKLSLTLIPQAVGWVTNPVNVQSASSSPLAEDVPIYIEGLSIQRNGPNSVLLKVAGQAGWSYEIQESQLASQSSTYQWLPLTNFVFVPPLFQMTNPVPISSPGVLYRLKNPQ